MESGGTRMGSRSSTRYGPSSVFSGPVRKWSKTWVPIPSSSSPSPSPSPSPHASRVLVYKWTPLGNGTKDEAAEDPTVRRVRYIPVSVIEEQRKEASKKVDEPIQTTEAAMLASEDTNKCEGVATMAQSSEVAPVIVQFKVSPYGCVDSSIFLDCVVNNTHEEFTRIQKHLSRSAMITKSVTLE